MVRKIAKDTGIIEEERFLIGGPNQTYRDVKDAHEELKRKGEDLRRNILSHALREIEKVPIPRQTEAKPTKKQESSERIQVVLRDLSFSLKLLPFGDRDFSESELAWFDGFDSRQHIVRVLKLRESFPPDLRDLLETVVFHAFEAGLFYQRMQVRPAGPNALTGRKTRKALSEKRDAKSKRFNEERLSEYQAEYKAIHKANPRLSYTAITDRVGKKFGVTGRAVRDQIPNPKK